MRRLLGSTAFLMTLALMLGAAVVEGQDAKKKSALTSPTFSGKIVQLKVDPQTKKVESLDVEVNAGSLVNRTVRVDDRTKYEYSGIFNKDDMAPRLGFIANVKLRANSDVAESLKISPATAKAKAKKKGKN